mgnify:CR=1 FL=1
MLALTLGAAVPCAAQTGNPRPTPRPHRSFRRRRRRRAHRTIRAAGSAGTCSETSTTTSTGIRLTSTSAAGGDAGQINIDGAEADHAGPERHPAPARLLPARQRSLVQVLDSLPTRDGQPGAHLQTGRSGVRQERLPAGEERRPARRFLLRDDQHADLRERRRSSGATARSRRPSPISEAWLRPRTLACR